MINCRLCADLKPVHAFKLIWLNTECKWNENKTKNETGTKKTDFNEQKKLQNHKKLYWEASNLNDLSNF